MQIQYVDRATGQLLTESPPAEGLLKFLYGTSVGRGVVLPLARRKFLTELYGRRMDKPASVKRIPGFVESLGIDLSEAEKSLEEFTSFNDFFYRKLKPGVRPIGEGFVSPGDGRLLTFDNASGVNEFYVKGRAFTLPDFLADKALAERFHDAVMLILRLAPNDYHRYHFPCAGTPAASQVINGGYLSVSPHALVHDFAKVFVENQREYTLLEDTDYGRVLLAPVGAAMVGSIISTYAPGEHCQKGDEMGYFAFGGSSIVVLADRERLTIDADLLENTRRGYETFVRMGESIGK
ncbi:phosphatidylserine decarboxylase [Lewinella sp. W8]|uniref:phosphatidylserine decarboxylase n=1 Tax=Lewinella sp. W8 TaxID=2528208 RepID=UPI0010677464|nr:phosphatidylserine decarboxylase [Lewinella sp. W8]MTB53701.1 phosphatidylserine decarboxylase [Lewinella sp. W8]